LDVSIAYEEPFPGRMLSTTVKVGGVVARAGAAAAMSSARANRAELRDFVAGIWALPLKGRRRACVGGFWHRWDAKHFLSCSVVEVGTAVVTKPSADRPRLRTLSAECGSETT